MSNEAEDKINAAIKILTDKEAGKYICYFLNTYDYGDTDIVVDKVEYTDEKLQLEEKYKKLVKDFNIKKIEKQINIQKDGNLISIITCNRSSGSGPDGDPYDFSKLLVFKNDACVLEESIDLEYNIYGETWRKNYFFEFTLKKFKNTSWMDELKEYAVLIDEFKKNSEEKIRLEKLNDASKDIEL